MRKFAIVIAVACLSIAAPLPMAFAADLTVEAPATELAPVDAEASLHSALSNYLSLQMIRATFDVVERDDLDALLQQELLAWGGRAPSPAAKADLDRQLLAEASYYLTSLSYTVRVGGAVFPGDKAEMVYINDTIVELDDLQRELALAIAAGDDVVPILTRTEEVRSLTEGLTEVPPEMAIFKDHAAILDGVIETAAKGTQT